MDSPSWSKSSTSYASVVRGESDSSNSDQDERGQSPSWMRTLQMEDEDEAVKIALAKSVLVGTIGTISERFPQTQNRQLSHTWQGLRLIYFTIFT